MEMSVAHLPSWRILLVPGALLLWWAAIGVWYQIPIDLQCLFVPPLFPSSQLFFLRLQTREENVVSLFRITSTTFWIFESSFNSLHYNWRKKIDKYFPIGHWRLMSQKKKQQTSHSIQFNFLFSLSFLKVRQKKKKFQEREEEKKKNRRRNGGKRSSRNCSSESKSDFCVSFPTVTVQLQLLLTVHLLLLLYNYYYSMATITNIDIAHSLPHTEISTIIPSKKKKKKKKCFKKST
jgi:hypothetical protein